MLGFAPKFGSRFYISVEEITMSIIATFCAVTTFLMAVGFALFMLKETFKSN
jgi:hypothetical protein